MKLITLILSFILSLTSTYLHGQADAEKYANTIHRDELKKQVYVLASDSCSGRSAGSEGSRIAARYIIDQWKESSLIQPFLSNSYYQSIPLIHHTPGTAQFQIDEDTLSIYKDYFYTGIYDDYNTELPVVFAGYGIENDLDELDIEGKAVFLLNDNLRASFRDARNAEKHGAALSVIANPEITDQFEKVASHYKNYRSIISYHREIDTIKTAFPEEFSINYRSIIINNSLVKKLSSHQISYWKNTAKPGNAEIGRLKMNIEPSIEDTLIGNNLVACIPGSHQDEFIVIGAHYDHLGMKDGEFYPGADDNASGTASLITLAQIFSDACKQGYKPLKTILFIAFTAEEGGLHGSKYFIDQFSSPENIKLMINIDMIGRSSYELDNISNRFFFVGHNLADSVYEQNDQLCKKYRLAPDYSSSISASDHKSFFERGIPTVFFFDGRNRDLHKISDTPEKISYRRMEKITRLIFETAWKQAGMSKDVAPKTPGHSG